MSGLRATGTGAGRAVDDWGVMQARYEELSLDTQGDGEVIDVTAQAQKAIDNAGHRRRALHRVRRPLHLRHDDHRVRAGLQRRPQRRPRADRARGRAAGSTTSATPTPTATATPGPRSIGPSVTVPLAGGELMLGVWQKIVCVDFDDRPADRARSSSSSSASSRPRRSAPARRRRSDRRRMRSSIASSLAPHHRHSTRSTCSSSTSVALDRRGRRRR